MPGNVEALLVPLALVTYGKHVPAAPPALLLAQVRQESAWNPTARSPVGALGLTQFMPATWKWVGAAYGLGVGDPSSPADALVWQATYMRAIEKNVRHATQKCDRWMFALSGYNGGEGWVQRRQKRSLVPGEYLTTSLINPGILPANQRENSEYPIRIYKGQARYTKYGTLVCDNLNFGVK